MHHNGMQPIDPLAQEKRLTLKATLPKGLAHVYIDRKRIEQVLINLIKNAIQYTPMGEKLKSRQRQLLFKGSCEGLR